MADSKRLSILKKLTTQLESVSIANGYQHNLDDKVFRGRATFGNETEWPFVSIFEIRPDLNPDYADETVQKDVWTLGVQGVVKSDSVHPTDPAHNLLADIRKALGQVMDMGAPHDDNPDYLLGGLIAEMKVDGGVTFVPEQMQEVAVCIVKVSIQLVEDMRDTYEN